MDIIFKKSFYSIYPLTIKNIPTTAGAVAITDNTPISKRKKYIKDRIPPTVIPRTPATKSAKSFMIIDMHTLLKTFGKVFILNVKFIH